MNNVKHYDIIYKYGFDILNSKGMLLCKNYRQHGSISVFDHSIRVANLCILMAYYLPFKVNMKCLVRGALLHDYFLYDWHVKDASHKWHGFHHAQKACLNAIRDFDLDEIEKDMIKKHMFPLNIHPPKYKESIILCLADKFSTINESIFHLNKKGKLKTGENYDD